MTAPADRFESTASHYAAYRPGYPDAVIDHLAETFALDSEARVLDLGCGPGTLALPLAAHGGHVIGMDPNAEMLAVADARASDAGIESVAWVEGSDADLHAGLAPLRLTVMGRSFHWMDEARTLATLDDLTEPGGGVALVSDTDWLTRGTERWQAIVHETASEFIDLPERTGPVTYDDSWADKLARSAFSSVETATFPVEREWTVEGIVGYVRTLSYASPARFGDDRAAFERAVAARLTGGSFRQETAVEVVCGSR